MPLVRIENVGDDARLALWHMTERVDELPVSKFVDLDSIHAEFRKRETLTEYCLLKALTSRDDLAINHLPSDKPFIDGYNISISHTRGWAAIILSEQHRVGVDIEYYSDRVNRVAERFIRPDEQNENTDCRLINWSAKETVYKLYSEEDLQYFEMKLDTFKVSDAGMVVVDDLKVSKSINVDYILNKDYVLTYAIV